MRNLLAVFGMMFVLGAAWAGDADETETKTPARGLEFRRVAPENDDHSHGWGGMGLWREITKEEVLNLDLQTMTPVPDEDVGENGKSVSTGRVLYDWLIKREELREVAVPTKPAQVRIVTKVDDDGNERQVMEEVSPPEFEMREMLVRDFLLVAKPAEMDGRAIASVKAEPNPQRGDDAWRLAIEFTPEGAKDFARVTKAMAGQRLAIVWNGRLLAAPRIDMEITGGRAVIDNFDKETAEEIAEAIKAMNDGADSD